MFNVVTLLVVSGREQCAGIEDIVRGVRWSCQMPLAVVCVDELSRGKTGVETDDHVVYIDSPLPETTSGVFHRMVGVRAALRMGITFQYAMLLSDKCLVLGRGLDHWAMTYVTKEGLGMLGVLQRVDYEEAFRAAIPCFYDWKIQHRAWERPPMTLADDVLLLPYQAAVHLQDAKLLVPGIDGLSRWPTTGGAYYSWLLQMTAKRVVGWGLCDQPLPPLFVSCDDSPRVAPMLLSESFLLYSSAAGVPHYTEEYLREVYKRHRGEVTREIPRFAPIVSPDPH